MALFLRHGRRLVLLTGFPFTAASFPPAVQHAEESGDKEERRDGREEQAANHGTSQRRVLLATISETKGHRKHPDDHGESGHENGAKPYEAGTERRGMGIANGLLKLLAGEADDQDRVGSGDSHAHDGASERGNANARVGKEEEPDDSRNCRG